MDLLSSIIQEMTKEEVRHFKVYLKRQEYQFDRKDEILFEHIRKAGEVYDDDEIARKLYPGKHKDVFHRLKNRLLEYVNRSLIIQNLSTDESMKGYYLLLLFRFHNSRKNHRAASIFLNRAEKFATGKEDYELLDVIYNERIRLGRTLSDTNPEEYIEKQKANQQQLSQLRQIDQVMAVVYYRLQYTQNFSSDIYLMKMLEETVSDFTADQSLKKSKTLQTKIFQAVSQVLLQKHDYPALEKYAARSYTQFEKQQFFDKQNHDVRLQMLAYLCNAAFLNSNYKTSLKNAALLKKEMDRFNKLHHDRYLIFYYNIQVINYSRLDRKKAIELLKQVKDEPVKAGQPVYQVFFYFNLALCYFKEKRHEEAIREIVKMQTLSAYKLTAAVTRLKMAMVEMMIRFELDDYNIVQYRLGQMQREFKQELKEAALKRELQLLQFIPKMIKSKDFKKEAKLNEEVQDFINTAPKSAPPDQVIVGYEAWLSEKFGF